ncbi:MAG: NAD(P)-dependent oxidoreductase [Alkalinema sp. RU_4_3]|nr:NAD(P)-dependent oxidoreductase [Alkalinema sp. RU_4_3]
MSDRRIGLIGLGLMGNPMGHNLLKAGYELTVYNRTQSKTAELAAAGARVAGSPADCARDVDVVISCVSDSPDVEAIALGSAGIIEALRSGMLYIDMSTIAPAVSRRIYDRFKLLGCSALDAPVSGGDIGAKAGTLSIMVGGDGEAFDRALPILQVLGKNIVHIGDAGAGQVTKACNQIVVALTVQAVAEALTLAKKSGVDPGKVREALLGGFGQSRVMEVHGAKMLEGNFAPGFKLDLFRKDMNLVLQTARELGLPLMGSHQVVPLMDALIAGGGGDRDFISVLALYEKLAHLE